MTHPLTILSIDYGMSRTGLAIRRASSPIALPLKTLHAKGEQIWPLLDEVMRSDSPDRVVIGLPLKLDGQSSEQTTRTRLFIDRFKERYAPCSVEILDERLTSRQAERWLGSLGMKRRKRAEVSDETSAWILLSCYLEREALNL